MASSPPPLPPRTVYQYTHPFAERCRRAAKLKSMHVDCVPLICEPDTNLLTGAPDAHPTAADSPLLSSPRAAVTTTATPRTGRGGRHARGGVTETSQGATVPTIAAAGGLFSSSPPAHRQLVLPLVLPRSTRLGEVILLVRNRLVLDPAKSVYLLVGTEGRVLLPTSKTVGDIYDAFKDADDYLYVLYAVENTYGGG